jgi:hypothetical protein
VLDTVRDNKDIRRDCIERMEKERYRKVALHYHPTGRSDLDRPSERWK